MSLPGLVLIHGGAHAGDCWELTVAELAYQEPQLRVLAVDLPGRGRTGGDSTKGTIADWAESVVADIDRAGMAAAVVVGHSMGGLVVPKVAAKLGAARVREIVMAAAFVPPQGSSVVHSLRGPLAPLARMGPWLGLSNRSFAMPAAAAGWAFWNGLPPERRRLARDRLYPENASVIVERVDRTDLPDEVPRTWIMTLRDRALSPAQQHRCIEALGGVDTLVCLDTCHDLMYSEPERLAAILLARCRARS
ncbi:alpha/beta fold hydrolase [Mycobacterium vicinigordonae]|uniref:Alpha/beta fold hydrolase n=1 Tax=Mycobacterium vicinigordonae TaxID=1719132 RepID=A0A7D6HX84_9MYCO|nr:alpha/beta hydrolase [Mycobacterium vicinigordonae]QLL06775.1 alpha/beta fold hydrolase [Mycobacterium vicinigordonae]